MQDELFIAQSFMAIVFTAAHKLERNTSVDVQCTSNVLIQM